MNSEDTYEIPEINDVNDYCYRDPKTGDHVWRLQGEARRAVDAFMISPTTIRYKMGKRWFNASCGTISFSDAIFEIQRLFAIKGISRVYAYNKDGKLTENWSKAEIRREDKEDERAWKKALGAFFVDSYIGD